jgi:hypothetical protein
MTASLPSKTRSGDVAAVSQFIKGQIHVAQKGDVEMRIFELEDVIALLRSKVKPAGGHLAWS